MRFSLLLLCSNLLLFAQDTPSTPEKGVLAGKVLNSVTGEPMRKAHVALISMADRTKGKQASPSPASTVTDAAGSFEFTALAPGSYRVDDFREGFVSPNGRKPSWLPHLTLASGEEKRDIVIRLAPPGVITGRSEEHTFELQSLTNLVCRLLLEKKRKRFVSASLAEYTRAKVDAI